MSTREKFEAWCNLTERDPTDRDLYAAWEESRAVALEEALTAVISERLEDPTKNPDDVAYDMGVDDCADAIRALAKDGVDILP